MHKAGSFSAVGGEARTRNAAYVPAECKVGRSRRWERELQRQQHRPTDNRAQNELSSGARPASAPASSCQLHAFPSRVPASACVRTSATVTRRRRCGGMGRSGWNFITAVAAATPAAISDARAELFIFYYKCLSRAACGGCNHRDGSD